MATSDPSVVVGGSLSPIRRGAKWTAAHQDATASPVSSAKIRPSGSSLKPRPLHAEPTTIRRSGRTNSLAGVLRAQGDLARAPLVRASLGDPRGPPGCRPPRHGLDP